MRFFFFILLTILCNLGHSQTNSEIILSRELEMSRTGDWTQGDYKIQVDLNELETNLRSISRTYLNAIELYQLKDTDAIKYYTHTAQRYQLAVNTLAKAGQEFDLKNLTLYLGIEKINQHTGNSKMIEGFIKQSVMNGSVIVFYKGTRIYKLLSQYKATGTEILDSGYETRIYVEDEENCIFKDYTHLGW